MTFFVQASSSGICYHQWIIRMCQARKGAKQWNNNCIVRGKKSSSNAPFTIPPTVRNSTATDRRLVGDRFGAEEGRVPAPGALRFFEEWMPDTRLPDRNPIRDRIRNRRHLSGREATRRQRLLIVLHIPLE